MVSVLDDDILLKIFFYYRKIKLLLQKKIIKYMEKNIMNYKKMILMYYLICTDDKNEEGSYFNPFAIYFIEICYKEIINSSNYNIIENIKNFVCL